MWLEDVLGAGCESGANETEATAAKDWQKEDEREARLRARFAEKVRSDGKATREEVAAHFDVDERTVKRWERAGKLVRCSNLGTLVRYVARDVLRLASANGKER